MIAFLAMETLIVGVFCSLDFVMFYIFFEGQLIPMFLIIGIWGGARRVYSAFKFFLYTLVGSVLFLLAILFMYLDAGTTDIPALLMHEFAPAIQTWLWLALFASFAVKLPMWPFHTWLPGRPRGGADGGLGDPRRHPAEDGRLRLPPLLAADAAGGERLLRALRLFAEAWSRSSTPRWSRSCSRT